MFKKIPLLLLITTNYLLAAETAYAWGYGDLMIETLKVVKYVFTIGEFRDVWKIAMIVGLISALFTMLTPHPDYLKLPKLLVLSMGIYTIFVTAKIDIYVDDRADNNNSGLVTGVPWAVGWPLGFFSTLEYRMGFMYEAATSIPNGMKYSDSGFFTPMTIFSQAIKHQIVTPSLYQNINNYIKECVMPDLENGYKDYRTLVDSDNVWAYMGNTSPATFMLYVDPNDNKSKLQTCTTVYNNINNSFQTYVSDTGMEYLGKSLGLFSSTAISSQLGVANQFLLESSKTASQMLLQNTAINTFSKTFRDYAAVNGADIDNVAFYSANASAAASAQMIVSGILGSKYVPLIKGILTVIVIGLTPLLMLLMITPIGFKTLVGYIMMLAWLASWHFGDVILNHIITTKAQKALSSYGDTTFATRGLIDSTITDYINMASSMYWTIPTIALVVVTGFSLSALASLNNAMTSKLDRTATAVGGDMARGNMNFGNVSHSNYNANKLNASADRVMGNSSKVNQDFNEFVSGNRVLNENSSTTNGMQNFAGGGSSQNNSFNSLVEKMSAGTNITDYKGKKEAIGSKDTNGNEIYSLQADEYISGTTTNGDKFVGQVGKDGIRATFDKDNNIHIVDGSHTANFGDENNSKATFNHRNGNEFERILENAEGKVVAKTLSNGIDKAVTITSNLDKDSYIEGIHHAKGNNLEVTNGNLNGIEFSKGKGSDISYSSSTVQSAAKELALSKQGQELLQKINGELNASTSSLDHKTTGNGSVGVGLEFLGNGAKVNLGHTTGIGSGTNNSVTVQNSNGETQTISLTESEKNILQGSLQRNATENEKMSSSRDQIPKELETKINRGMDNGLTALDSFNDAIRNKDAISSSNNAKISNGVQEKVENDNLHSDLRDKYQKGVLIDDNKKQENKINAIKIAGLENYLEPLINQKGKVVPEKQEDFNKLYAEVEKNQQNDDTLTTEELKEKVKATVSNWTKGTDDRKQDREEIRARALENGYITHNTKDGYQVAKGQEDNLRNNFSITDIKNLTSYSNSEDRVKNADGSWFSENSSSIKKESVGNSPSNSDDKFVEDVHYKEKKEKVKKYFEDNQGYGD